MNGLDLLELCGLGWLYDRVEDRFGDATAWLVTLAFAVALLTALVSIYVTVL